jgi:poly-beta-1,6-N-acetyl-D-glucosamine synthase
MSIVRDVVWWSVLICFGYLLLLYLLYAVILCSGLVEQHFRRRRRRVEILDRVRESSLTIPVSIVAPVCDEAPIVAASTLSFLGVDYPEHEVIVVNDGSTDATLDVLRHQFQLEAVTHFFRRRFESAPIRGVYRSRSHSNLTVVDKENGGKADSLNCGLNFARYRYVCGVDGDTLLTPSALLNGMRVALSDPARVIGVTGHIAVSSAPEAALGEGGLLERFDRRSLLTFQHLDFVRAFFNQRLGWTRLNTMLCAPGAFQLWRRDVVEELGGYSTAFSCEDIEFTFRAHELFKRRRIPYEIVSLEDTVGVTEAPDSAAKLVAQRERWQRVILETVLHYRRMLFRPRYGSVAFIGLPFFMLSEVLAPVFEALALASLVVALALHMLDPTRFALMLAIVVLANATYTSAALLLKDRASRSYRLGDILFMLALSIVDLVAYRPITIWSQLKGTWRFLRGDKAWHKFERNVRPARSPA